MADFEISMSGDELPDEVVRLALARALISSHGARVDTAGGDVLLRITGIDWWDVALDNQILIDALWGGDETDALVAFDFGSGEWAVVRFDLLGRQVLTAVVPMSEQDEQFRQLIRSWIWENGWPRGHFPQVLASIAVGEAWLCRELVVAMRGNGPELADIIERAGESRLDPQMAFELWDHAVVVDGDGPPPELFAWNARGVDGAFAAWQDGLAITWDDTGQPLQHEDALRLWLVCQYLTIS
ncbi:MAG: hypothetical protein M9890_10745 [Thermomicrobiales bacterium]|nr:hypothetical protein [Thermomicrobiales bacterium]